MGNTWQVATRQDFGELHAPVVLSFLQVVSDRYPKRPTPSSGVKMTKQCEQSFGVHLLAKAPLGKSENIVRDR